MIPHELTQYPQWVLWRSMRRPNGEDTKLPYQVNNASRLASVDDPKTWSTYDAAVDAAQRLIAGVGFVLTNNDPYAFIDLDNACGNAAIIERQVKVANAFDTYSERSPSQTGLHIICKGSVPRGRRRDKIEVYSSNRYMTVTGWTYNDKPINDCSEMLRTLWDEIGGANGDVAIIQEQEQRYDDRTIYDQAREAANGDKFLSLWEGHWLDHGYPSQSEADYALINILSFYSRNIEQIKRMFYQSALGARDKAKRKPYIDTMIQNSFDNQPPYVDLTELDKNLRAQLATKLTVEVPTNGQPSIQLVGNQSDPIPVDVSDSVYDYSLPAGLLGETANYIYQSAPRQVKEVALAASIGLLAGICGREYNVSGTGLNQYVLLLAKTGTGKDSISSGINRIVNQVRANCPAILDFMGPGVISSGQALVKHLAKKLCFVSIVGEFGLEMQTMCSSDAGTNQKHLRKTMLELYSKSGYGEIYRDTIYSDQGKNVPPFNAPAFSILGESTPESYYGGLSEEMISQGVLPRFLCIEYKGKVPYLNSQHGKIGPSTELINKITQLTVNCLTLRGSGHVINIQFDNEAKDFSRHIAQITTDKLNSTEIIVAEQLWNRAHLKTIKLAALIAVGINCYQPVITLPCMQWSYELVERDIKNIFRRFEAGKIGKETNESSQLDDLKRIIKDYLSRPFDTTMSNYKVVQQMHSDRVIAWAYIQRRLLTASGFKNDRLGASSALKRCIDMLVKDGAIKEILNRDREARYKSSAQAWKIVDLNYFL